MNLHELSPTILLSFAALVQSALMSIFVVFSQPRSLVSWSLSLLLIALTCSLIHDLLLYSGALTLLPHLFGFGPLATYLYGPLVAVILIKMLSPEFSFKPMMLIHLIPFAIHFIDKSPIYFMPVNQKLVLVQQVYAEIGSTELTGEITLFFDWIWYYGHRMVYFIALVIWLFRMDALVKGVPSKQKHHEMVRRISLCLLLIYISYFLVSRIYLIVDHSDDARWLLLQLSQFTLSGFLLIAAYYLFKSPKELLKAMPYTKYKSEHIDNETSYQIFEQVVCQLKKDELFSHSDFSAAKLSAKLGLRNQQIYEAIHLRTGQTLQELVNELRVDKAALLLRNTDRKYSIEMVANLCGFSSRSTFNRQFLKYVGTTPSQFQKS